MRGRVCFLSLLLVTLTGYCSAQDRSIAQTADQEAKETADKYRQFAAIHIFKSVLSPNEDKVLLHAAWDYEANAASLIYKDVDYRMIDLATMNATPLLKRPLRWNTDIEADTRSAERFNDMAYIAALLPGTTPDSLKAHQRSIVSAMMKPQDAKYTAPEAAFVRQLQDGSLIFAVINKTWRSKKADIVLYRQPHPGSAALEEYFTLEKLEYPEPNIIMSANGKRVLYYDEISKSDCPVYDVPSGKKIATVDMTKDVDYNKEGLIKFSGTGDTIFYCYDRANMNVRSYNIRTKVRSARTEVPFTAFDEQTEEYGFKEDKKYPWVRRDHTPWIMDITADGRSVLVATSNKLALVPLDGTKPFFVTTGDITTTKVLRLRNLEEGIYPAISRDRSGAVSNALEKAERERALSKARESDGEWLTAEEQRMEDSKRRAQPPAARTSNPATTATQATDEKEADRHRKAMEQIERDGDRREKRYFDNKR